ncbi:aldehyde dehydrogenase family protein [Micromonospora sp. MA102]|uniref:aldehyde dehydrogenase family protein n=1 Tax=Micromonospora sp. MA102 TaxID=2952755 RepID=UPI0021C9405E|nr:aldehyde dehydrogenase family protein [Micromonospora sp. MA102]
MTAVDVSRDPRTGAAGGEIAHSTPPQIEAVLARAAAAAPVLAATAPAVRSRWLHAVADALEAAAEELVALADAETALGRPRLPGELTRTAGQLRFYGDVAAEGSYLDVTLDRATATAPALARVRVPLGPVAVFGASNFPFAFSVLGNDTASALAAGCPVVVKAHPAHPWLSQRLSEIARAALAAAGAPAGTFDVVVGFDAGVALVRDPAIQAVGFTGSQRAGLALRELANQRDVVIPVYAEMGTVNPAVITATVAADPGTVGRLLRDFVASFTLGSGQYCTKPGLLFVPAGHQLTGRAAEALLSAAPEGWSLTERIAAEAESGVDELVAAGATVVASVDGRGAGWSVGATLLSVPMPALRSGSRLLSEVFAPIALVAEYLNLTELVATLGQLQGALAASVFAAGDDPHLEALLAALSPMAGRVVCGQWPTGVAYTWAQHHGGPWPATSDPGATSVGAAALGRFTRPLVYQNVPDAALPEPLREGNPWGLPRRIDGRRTAP